MMNRNCIVASKRKGNSKQKNVYKKNSSNGKQEHSIQPLVEANNKQGNSIQPLEGANDKQSNSIQPLEGAKMKVEIESFPEEISDGCFYLTKEMQAEEEEMAKENQDREEELKRKLEEKDKMEEELKEQRHKSLMHLLTQSEFYSQFILKKIRTKETENKGKKRGKKMKLEDKENSASNSSSSQESLSQGKCLKRKRSQSSVNSGAKKYIIGDIIDEETVAANMKTTSSQEEKCILREEQPKLFENGTMRPYQLDGFSWLKVMYENGINGILADEMGLGKTIQCIALICHLIEMGVTGPFLIVAPLSTLPNWLSEFKRFAPKIETFLYHGSESSRKEKRKLLTVKSKLKDCTQSSAPVVVTSYEVSIKDSTFLKTILWRFLVVDEGHRLKNYKGQLAQTLCSFATTNRLLLTGTPLQNNLAELWSLLNFLLPEIFDSLHAFEAWFDINAMMEDGADEKIVQQEREKQVLSTLHKILNPFLLRRIKVDVDLDIPPKRELLVYTPMSPLQLKFYEATLTKDFSAIEELQKAEVKIEYDERGRPIRNVKKISDYAVYFDESDSQQSVENYFEKIIGLYGEEKSKVKILKTSETRLNLRNIMMQCRKIVNHPYLISYPLTSKGEYKIDDNLLKTSGKLHVLDQILAKLHSRGHKVLVFSQMTKLLDIIEDYLTLRPHFRYKRLDGNVPLENRCLDINEFNSNEDYFLYLLSTRAGGLGINLTAADTVIIYDSDWNPQQDLQAQDRCHRIGQTKPVLVLRFVTASTIDERIIGRASTKRKLEKMIIESGKFKSSLDRREEENVFDPEKLMSLLQQRDHEKIHKVSSGNAVFTEEELDQILDRSELVKKKEVPRSRRNANTSHLDGVFKVLPAKA